MYKIKPYAVGKRHIQTRQMKKLSDEKIANALKAIESTHTQPIVAMDVDNTFFEPICVHYSVNYKFENTLLCFETIEIDMSFEKLIADYYDSRDPVNEYQPPFELII
jgi:hypothetical protein